MTVILMLVVAWGVLLGPSVFRVARRELEARSGGSIARFHRHLDVLQHTNPQLMAGGLQLVHSATVRHVTDGPGGRAHPSRLARRRREAALQRRRFVMLLLAFAIVLTFPLGFVTVLHGLWVMSVLCVAAMVAFETAVVRMRTIATERHQKLTYIRHPPVRDVSPVVIVRRSGAL